MPMPNMRVPSKTYSCYPNFATDHNFKLSYVVYMTTERELLYPEIHVEGSPFITSFPFTELRPVKYKNSCLHATWIPNFHSNDNVQSFTKITTALKI